MLSLLSNESQNGLGLKAFTGPLLNNKNCYAQVSATAKAIV